MRRLMPLSAACALVAALLILHGHGVSAAEEGAAAPDPASTPPAAPDEATVQGLYEGSLTLDADGPRKVEGRLVALGQGTYQLLLRDAPAAEKPAKAAPAATPTKPPFKATLDGTTDQGTIRFTGSLGLADGTGTYADGAVRLTVGHTTSLLKRVTRRPPTLGLRPPRGAVVLIDGKHFDEINCAAPDPAAPASEPGALCVLRGGITSKRTFVGSFKLHVEFRIPFLPNARSQDRGNSGCYLPNGDEIQVLDSFGMTTYLGGGCGGIYRYKDPDPSAFDEYSLAALPPLAWQTYDVEYRVPQEDGKPTGKPRITVFHNGVKIHDHFELEKPAQEGRLFFQDHGNAVEYRNTWLLPLPDK